MFICQLSIVDRLRVYKAIKAYLIGCGVYSVSAVLAAMELRVADLPYSIQSVIGL